MAAYCAQSTISNAVESVLAQTYPNWELLIIDDCSKDDTYRIAADYARQDKRIRVFRNAVNSGVSATRKTGLEHAEGAWIAILDSDDLWLPEKLEKQMDFAEKTKAELIFTGSQFVDAKGRPYAWQLHVPQQLRYRRLLKQNLISNSSVLVRKDLYLRYYASGEKIHEDFALWLRITRAGCIARGIDEPLLIYRLSKTSKTGDKRKSARMNWNTYRFVGLGRIRSFYYSCWYAVNGILKYSHLRGEGN